MKWGRRQPEIEGFLWTMEWQKQMSNATPIIFNTAPRRRRVGAMVRSYDCEIGGREQRFTRSNYKFHLNHACTAKAIDDETERLWWGSSPFLFFSSHLFFCFLPPPTPKLAEKSKKRARSRSEPLPEDLIDEEHRKEILETFDTALEKGKSKYAPKLDLDAFQSDRLCPLLC